MIHLHTRSRYSLLEAVHDPADIIRLALENGQNAAVLSDHRSMFAVTPFLHAAKEAGIKPIIGLEFEILFEESPFSMLMLAKNSKGLENLYRLSTRLMSDNNPLPASELHEYVEGNFVLNAGGDEVLKDLALSGRIAELDRFLFMLAQESQTSAGLYIAMSLHDSPVFRKADEILRQSANQLNIPVTAISRIDYENPEEERTARLLAAIGASKNIDDPSLPVRSGRWWRSQEEMEQLYDPQDLAMTDQIAEQVEEYDLPKAQLPVFKNKAGVSSEEYLRKLCIAGLRKRLNGHVPEVYAHRLEHELQIILSMGFADYFLIVYDFIREARSRGILAGPGRGSAAGSLVAWVLGISHVDPVANGLLFERFLNPERISMPDIDSDFPDNRRDEIIEYVQDTYGKYHAAHIVTFSRLKAKAALRDCARALNVPIREVDRLSRHIPSGPTAPTLEGAMQTNAAFASEINNNRDLQRVYEAAKSIENFPRHTSIHAGGIVLARDPIFHQAPLMEGGSALPVVQFTMEYLEEIGLIKFDFLGLRNLSMLDAMVHEVREQTGHDIDLLKLPLDDPAVYKLLGRAETLGVFQLESDGIRKLLVRFRPERFEDIAAVLALYRPGPMKSINTYLNARFHPETRKSIHPLIDPLLAPTGGIFLYQEQIMEAARILGGFSLAQADILRKAMSKKKRSVMEEWKAKFVAGARERGVGEEEAGRIFEIMEEFADYGFNKSHSYAYSLIVYEMAWMKARFPLQFYQVLLSQTSGSGVKTGAIMREAAGRGVRVLPISLNRSTHAYSVENGALRMPLTLVKTFGQASVIKIEQERGTHGPFDDPVMAVLRLSHLGFSSDQIRMLVQIGAFEETGLPRESLDAALDEILRLSDLAVLDEKSSTWRLAGVSSPVIAPVQPSPAGRILKEIEILGFSLSPHPAIRARSVDRSLRPVSSIASLPARSSIRTVGLLGRVRTRQTKKGQTMAYSSLSDETGTIQLAIMPKAYSQAQAAVVEGSFVMIEGRTDESGSVAVFYVQRMPMQ